jgi:predicted lipoprotein
MPKNITPNFNADDVQNLKHLMDAGLKSLGGQAAIPFVLLMGKIEAAEQAAREQAMAMQGQPPANGHDAAQTPGAQNGAS